MCVCVCVTCSKVGFTIARRNEIRDLTASLMREVCTDVEVEPRQQPMSGEGFLHSSANRDPEARLDVKARGLWGDTFECAFLCVRVFNPAHAQTRLAVQQPRSSAATSNTNDVNTTSKFETWRWPPSRLLSLLRAANLAHQPGSRSSASPRAFVAKLAMPYSAVMGLVQCRVSFSFLLSAVICLSGSRQHVRAARTSHRGRTLLDTTITEKKYLRQVPC